MANLRRRLGLRALLLLTLVSVILTSPVTVLASPTSNLSHAKRQDTPAATSTPSPEEPRCGFDGDQDTYGLGIRIGLYFQWVTSALAYNFVPSEAVTLRGVNNAFQAAMFAGLLWLTIKRGEDLFAVEAFLMLLFCMGGICSATFTPSAQDDISEPDTALLNERASGAENGLAPAPSLGPEGNVRPFAMYEASTVGGYVRLLLASCFNGYGIWFVFHGMDHMLHPSCSTFVFFFARVNLYGWFRTLLKVMLVISGLGNAILFVTGTKAFVERCMEFRRGGWKKLGEKDNSTSSTTSRPAITNPITTTTTSPSNNAPTPDPTAAAATTGSSSSTSAPIPNPTATTATTTATSNHLSSSNMEFELSVLGQQCRRLRRRQSLFHETEANAVCRSRLSEPDPETEYTTPKGNTISLTLPLFVTMVELTVRWNRIQGVCVIGSTGQLLPLIIGVGGLWRVIYKLVKNILTKMAKAEREQNGPGQAAGP